MPGFDAHDHSACISHSLEAADARAARDGLRLTKIRRRVLEILLEEHKALGAYEILERLKAEGHANQPPVAYRALEFLTKAGFAHRIERLNAFVACTSPEARHAPIFMICRACDAVAEAGSSRAGKNISDTAEQVGFTIDTIAIEAEGLCNACQGTEQAP